MQKIIKTCLFLTLSFAALALFGCSSNGGPGINGVPSSEVGTISGVLRDSVTNSPIVGATVNVLNISATTDSEGQFVLLGVPAQSALGNQTGVVNTVTPGTSTSKTDPYLLTIDMTRVNAAIKNGALYPTIAYTTANVAWQATFKNCTTNCTNTPTIGATPSGYVAVITPVVGKLDANIQIQVQNCATFANVSGATVQLLYDGSGVSTQNNNVGRVPQNVIATQTANRQGIVTFTNVEAATCFDVYAVSPDGTLATVSYTDCTSGSSCGGYGGSEGSDSYSSYLTVTSLGDNTTNKYLAQGPNAAILLSPVNNTKPIITSVTPGPLPSVQTSGTMSVVYTFSEPIQQNAYSMAITLQQSQQLALEGASSLYGDMQVLYSPTVTGVPTTSVPSFTLAWNSTFTTLTVTFPTINAANYYVSISGALNSTSKLVSASNNNLALTDRLGNATVVFITNNGALVTTAPVIALNTLYQTPSANSKIISWLPVPNAYQYNVYVQQVVDGVSSQFVLLSQTSNTIYNLTSNPLPSVFIQPTNNGPYPFYAGSSVITYNIYVVALDASNNMGPQSNVLTLKDQTEPAITSFDVFDKVGVYQTFSFLADGNSTLALLDPTNLATASASKSYAITVTFSKLMSTASVTNPASWAIGKGTATAGGLFVAGAADVLPAISSISYDPTTNIATVIITYTQNATTTATTDPQHTTFTFSGTDVSGIAMNATANAFDEAFGIF